MDSYGILHCTKFPVGISKHSTIALLCNNCTFVQLLSASAITLYMVSRRNDTNWCLVGEMRVGKMRVGKMRVGEMRQYPVNCSTV